MSLTKKQTKMYSDLIKEYNESGLCNICSLDAFLKMKLDNCRDVMTYQNLFAVAEYAENDF